MSRAQGRAQFGIDGSALGFSVALQMGRVVIPLLALQAGLGATGVGVLTGISAVAQIGARGVLPGLMRRVPDRALIQASAALLGCSYLLLVLSRSIWMFVVAELIQGGARAAYWTGAETHLVRKGRRQATGLLARLSVVSGLGGLIGPPIGGWFGDRSLILAAGVAGALAIATAFPALWIARLSPFEARERSGPRERMIADPRVRTGSWASFAVGGWRALVSSYIPVVLVAAGQSASTVGVVLAVGNGALLLMSVLFVRLSPEPVPAMLASGVAALGAGLVLCTLLAARPAAAGISLALSGLGAGALQIMGPALAGGAVADHRRGDAIVTSGLFRSVAYLLSPFAIAALIPMAGLAAAMVSVEVILAVPLLAANVSLTGRTQDHVGAADGDRPGQA